MDDHVSVAKEFYLDSCWTAGPGFIILRRICQGVDTRYAWRQMLSAFQNKRHELGACMHASLFVLFCSESGRTAEVDATGSRETCSHDDTPEPSMASSSLSCTPAYCVTRRRLDSRVSVALAHPCCCCVRSSLYVHAWALAETRHTRYPRRVRLADRTAEIEAPRGGAWGAAAFQLRG
jgi:hypothetical protein